jgi:thymidine kinase
MNSHGYLELIVGNMFSGKSTELIRRIKTFKSINKKVLVINYIHDNRYSTDSVATHDKLKVESKKTELLMDLLNDALEYQIICIDEGQFFKDLIGFVKTCVDVHKKHIIVSGLDGDSNRNKFGHILDLIPIADSLIKLKAYCINCSDGTYAPFTKKIKICNDQIDEIIDIGSADKYIPVCRYHFFNF